MSDSQEQARSERVGLAVTALEKRALEFVATARGVEGVSLLLRDMSLHEVVAEYHRLLGLLRNGETAA